MKTKLPDSVADQVDSWLDYNQKSLEEINKETEDAVKEGKE